MTDIFKTVTDKVKAAAAAELNSPVPDKYERATLPTTADEATAMADARDSWAEHARKSDLNGSAREMELCADLLRFYAGTLQL